MMTPLTEHQASVLLYVLIVALVAGIAYLSWSLHRAAHGAEIHVHPDGTAHEHYGGGRPHQHPTWAERWVPWATDHPGL